jgi:hypothetical protein
VPEGSSMKLKEQVQEVGERSWVKTSQCRSTVLPRLVVLTILGKLMGRAYLLMSIVLTRRISLMEVLMDRKEGKIVGEDEEAQGNAPRRTK